MDYLDLIAVQGTLKSLLQHHSSKASILWCSAFFTVQRSHPYMTTGKTIAQMGLSRQSNVSAFQYAIQVGYNFSSKEQHLLISWLKSPSFTFIKRLFSSSSLSAISLGGEVQVLEAFFWASLLRLWYRPHNCGLGRESVINTCLEMLIVKIRTIEQNKMGNSN